MIEDNLNPNKDKKPWKWVLLGVVILTLIAGVSWYFSRDKGGLKEGTVVIKAGDTVLGSFTVADLQKLPRVEKRMTVTTNCNGACGNNKEASTSEHDYTGASLAEVLKSIDPKLTAKYSKVITKGIDFYSQVMDMTDIQKPDEVYIAYSDNGQALKTKDGKDGSMQVVVASDKTGQRFTKWLVSLDLQ